MPSQLLKMNGGDLEKALASYNWGIGDVQKHGMGLMPQETRNYIPRVLSNMPGSAGGGQEATTFNINVQGGGDPRETARLTGDAGLFLHPQELLISLYHSIQQHL